MVNYILADQLIAFRWPPDLQHKEVFIENNQKNLYDERLEGSSIGRLKSKSDVLEPHRSSRYNGRREEILDVATRLLNEKGVAGMTFSDVARTMSLSTTSINYYFESKEKLAAAVFSDSLDRLKSVALEAGAEATPCARVERYIILYVAVFARSLAEARRPFANLSEIRTLDEAVRTDLVQQYQLVFRLVRDFFGLAETSADKARNTARAHIVNETLFWADRWLGRYAPEDMERVARRIFNVMDGGVAPQSVPPVSAVLTVELERSPRRGGETSFLPAATRLINAFGYRGASIDRIAAELKVTKGSFYHHLDTKDDLILECFQRSFERTAALLRTAEKGADTVWPTLGVGLLMLVDIQFLSSFPLMRSSALQAMPQALRITAFALLDRTALYIGGRLVDGMHDGSIRLTDHLIASQFILSAVNASYDVRNWAARIGERKAARIYTSILQYGIFDTRVC